MLLPRVGALLIAAGAASAYNHPSPFFFVSSEPLPHNASLKSTQLAKGDFVEDRLMETLSDCTAKQYTVYVQQGVSADDFRGSSGFSRTSKRLGQAKEGALIDIPNVGFVWNMDGDRVRERLWQVCLARGRRVINPGDIEIESDVVVKLVNLPELPLDTKKRASVIAETDKELDKQLQDVISGKGLGRSVLIYTTTGISSEDLHSHSYDTDESYDSTAMHTDLKRDVYPRQDDNSSEDAQAGLPLFEKYQFLTPAIFMGLFVSLILLLILYVGISAIAGLEVSYAAFSKEMGAQAQKKQQ